MRGQELIATESFDRISAFSGIWVTEKEFAKLFALNRQTLANWRSSDRRLGLKSPRPGYPFYRYFGSAVRYRLDKPVHQEGDGQGDGAAA